MGWEYSIYIVSGQSSKIHTTRTFSYRCSGITYADTSVLLLSCRITATCTFRPIALLKPFSRYDEDSVYYNQELLLEALKARTNIVLEVRPVLILVSLWTTLNHENIHGVRQRESCIY